MERLSAFLAAHPDESYTASAVRSATSGHTPSMARALDLLAAEAYAAKLAFRCSLPAMS